MRTWDCSSRGVTLNRDTASPPSGLTARAYPFGADWASIPSGVDAQTFNTPSTLVAELHDGVDLVDFTADPEFNAQGRFVQHLHFNLTRIVMLQAN